MTEESDEWAEILQDFLVESTDILDGLPQEILCLENHPEDPEQLNKIFRAFHTIKGSAGFLGLSNLAAFTHKLEDMLNKLRRFEMKVTPAIIDCILESADQVKALVEKVRETKKDNVDCSALTGRIQEFLSQAVAPQGASPPPPSPSTPPPAEALASDSGSHLEPAPSAPDPPAPRPRLGEILLEQKAVSPEQLEEALEAQDKPPRLGEILVEKKLAAPEDVARALAQQASKEGTAEVTLRVDVHRLDHLMNLVGELVLSRNRLIQMQRVFQTLGLPEPVLGVLGETINQIAFNTSELQMGVMRTRMLPVSRVFNKFQRLIRELERQTGKPIRLVITGEETELDKTIIEEVGDPLIHLIRNAVDHGIEPLDERLALGKDPQGTVHLTAAHQGNQIIIEIRDDGRGMDPEKIMAKALANGLFPEEQLRQMSHAELLNLIFLPGFSTAEKISDISGRGVGMDVVKNKINHLKGMIELESTPGDGSTVRLKLPLTLAIIPVLLVAVGRQTFAVPLTSVVESLRVREEEIYWIDGNRVLEFRGRIVPLVPLAELYRIQLPAADPPEGAAAVPEFAGLVYIVIVGLGEKLRGIVVDRFIAQEEIVIKSLTRFLGMVKGFVGCTIMGDGTVSLIIDIEHVINE